MARTSEGSDSVDQIGSENYDNDPDSMATHDEISDSSRDATEALIRHHLELGGHNGLNSPRQERDSSADRSDFDDNNVSGRKRKRSHSSVVSEKAQLDDTASLILDEDKDLPSKQPSPVSDTHGHHKRSKIETSTFSGKRISDELDSDDELMMQMRESGFSDRQIAQKLQKEGRVRYDEKSISTRIVRIHHAKAKKVDFLLKEGYKEWKYEEDKLLLQAYSFADIEINYEIERILAWRFRKVSDYMRRLNKDALFSATACRERYNALVEGTARIPTDLDDNPEARRTEIEEYRIAREKARLNEQAEEALKEATKAKLKAEKKSRKAQKAEEAANKRAQRAAEKAQRAAQRAEKAKLRAARAKEVQELKARRNAEIKEKAAAKTAKKASRPVPVPATPVATAAPTIPTSPTGATAPTPVKKTKTTTTSSTPKPKTKTNSITTDIPDPRSNLSLADLKKLCKDQSIRLSSNKNKTALLQVLKIADDKHSLKNLKSMCLAKGLSVTGSKTQLKYRLALAAAQSCASFGKGAGASAGTGLSTSLSTSPDPGPGSSTGEEGKKGVDETEVEQDGDDLVILKIDGV